MGKGFYDFNWLPEPIRDFYEGIIPREIRDPMAGGRHRAQAQDAEARRRQAEMERLAAEETARRLQADRRDARRRKGRQSTILASAPLGVSDPPGPAPGGRTTLG